jgi:Cu(I)/Ag(I) efflux system membrane protein CusA/SilA
METPQTPPRASLLAGGIRFFLENKLIVGLLTAFFVAWGVLVAPFDWNVSGFPRDPVPVDAIPDTGENQQIIFTSWPGRSPQDVEDQISYPLTVALLGVPGVSSIRSSSMFGFSSIFVIFEEDIEFYWSRSRLLEKLNSLPAGTLPEGVQPALGPDATPLGQVFWYTLEGRDKQGNPTGGWDLHELRTTQDWHVRYALASVDGVAEVASIGGYVKEYQIDVDPDAMRAHGITLHEVFKAVQGSNVDVGARTIEVNRAEYVVRGLGFIETLDDIEETVVGVADNVPITIREIGTVSYGPALRRGALDKGGAEAVGGVVVVRYGANPLAVINGVKEKLDEIAAGLPTKVLDDGRISQVAVVPFYDRSGLIYETLGTLNSALEHEILVTIIVVLVMVGHLRSAALISGLLPLAVLMCFIAMKHVGVDANIVALSGIAIAIGTMVDVGIVLTENILKHVHPRQSARERFESIYMGATEVASAVLTAVLTTVVSFLPVFTMEGAEGKLFKPLAYTKTFALIASIVVALVIIPPAAHLLLGRGDDGRLRRPRLLAALLLIGGLVAAILVSWWVGLPLIILGAWRVGEGRVPQRMRNVVLKSTSLVVATLVAFLLAGLWEPLGPGHDFGNLLFTVITIGGVLLAFQVLLWTYEPVLRWCLAHKFLFLIAPTALVLLGGIVWLGFQTVAGPLATPIAHVTNAARWVLPESIAGKEDVTQDDVVTWKPWVKAAHAFPGLGKEFMPPLDEGSFLLMPVTMAHASIGEAFDLLQQQDMLIRAIPEVEEVVGKIGRAESPLDPAPISMVETVITYKPEYKVDSSGHRLRFAYDDETGAFLLDDDNELIPDEDGRPFRQWRDHIKSATDIWVEIEKAAAIPGMTTASMLQPIETRRIMLQTGMRAPMGIKVYGPDLETIEQVALDFEQLLRDVPSVRPATVIADRVIGKPYLEIDIDRRAIARYGLSVRAVQDVIEVAIGGKQITSTVEGRERYPVRVRYQRELRDQIEELSGILVAGHGGVQVPLGQLADIRYTPGPQNIKSEDTFLVAYVLFSGQPGIAEVDVVEDAQEYLAGLISTGEYSLPAGVSYKFAGNYENQQRATARLRVVLPLALFIIFIILYLQFRSTVTTGIVFSAVFVAWSGGFLMLWLYGQDWFLNFDLLGIDLRELFQVGPINLSVAVWVGFLALFGIATDDGVIMATYIKQTFDRDQPRTKQAVVDAVVEAGKRRIRPCLMTTATTTLALMPILTSTGRGSDVMVPMAIPSIGGMTVALITIFVVPTLYCLVEELKLRRSARTTNAPQPALEGH